MPDRKQLTISLAPQLPDRTISAGIDDIHASILKKSDFTRIRRRFCPSSWTAAFVHRWATAEKQNVAVKTRPVFPMVWQGLRLVY